MKTALYRFTQGSWQHTHSSYNVVTSDSQLVLCFGGKNSIRPNTFDSLKAKFPNAQICITSTAGEILGDEVFDESLVAISIEFEKTNIKTVATQAKTHVNSKAVGSYLSEQLSGDDLKYIMVFSDGSSVNGSELVKGLSESNVLVTGGLAADGDRFQSTLIGLNSQPSTDQVVAIGFYGSALQVSHGSQGGWESFGTERIVTKSQNNILYEIDGENALELYKRYLGEAANELPGAALLYPLQLKINENEHSVVRTILSIDDDKKSMIFAGDLPIGSKVKLMRATFDRLNSAASKAATLALKTDLPEDSFALLVSCVGRKLVLGPLVDNEVEAVQQTLGDHVPLIGFYSYGEISPFNNGGNCQLHNQTMTITTFHEV